MARALKNTENPQVERRSDDEEITIEDVRKCLSLDHRKLTGRWTKDDQNQSLKIIEMGSAPNLSTNNDILVPIKPIYVSSPDLSPDPEADSICDVQDYNDFMKLDYEVANLNITPQIQINCVDSTLETKGHFPQEHFHLEISEKSIQSQKDTSYVVPENEETCVQEGVPNLDIETPLRNNGILAVPGTLNDKSTLDIPNLQIATPPRNDCAAGIPGISNNGIFYTPYSETKKAPKIKTPGKNSSQNKQKYQNMISPVATYIKKSPHIPLLKDIRPKKPLPGVSYIPVMRPNKVNKEDMNGDKQEKFELPTVCYKSAKETKIIHIPDVGKMPQNQWAKRVESSIPTVTVIKHQHREANTGKKSLLQNQDDSFADLSLHQADLSICTKKSAFKKL